MNHNASTYVRNHETTPTIKKRITALLSVGIALYAVFGGMPCADAVGFLPDQMIVSTVPPNGDVNPYGVAFVPQGFPNGGPLQAARSQLSLPGRLTHQEPPVWVFPRRWQCSGTVL